MKRKMKILAAVLVAALVIGSLSGCGAIGPMLIQLTDVVNNAQQQIDEAQSGSEEDILGDILNPQKPSAEEQTQELPASEEETAVEEQVVPEETAVSEETTASETETESSAPQKEDIGKLTALIPEYEHYDPTQFYKDCEEMVSLAEQGKADEANKLYEAVYEELLKVEDLYTVSDLNAYNDTTNDAYEKENEYSHDLAIEMEDAFCSACLDMITGKGGEAFSKYLDDDYLIDYYKSYDKMTDELKKLYSRETELQNDYYDIIDGLEDITCTYEGKEYRFGDVIDNGDAMYNEDPEKYYAVFDECYKQLNLNAGEIFVELVQLRDKIAKLNGYDNYNDYADEELYGRKYSESDIEKMRTAARKFGGEYQSYYYNAYQNLPSYDVDTEQLLADCKSVVTGISPLADKAFQYMEENKLYSIGKEKERADVGFTTSFEGAHVPFIFIKTSGDANDLMTLTHEFGHFTDSYYNPNPYPVCTGGSYDLFEIHSTGLQLLADVKYEKVFGDQTNMVIAFNALNLMTYITDGCIFDEWQREVYKNPDMTLDEMNALFQQISSEYGVADYTGREYSWVEVSHNFSSPLYYISYATSAFASLQIWLQSLQDYGAAVSTWEKIIEKGAYTDDYMTVIKDVGLKTFDNSQAVYDVLSQSFQYAQSQLIGFSFNFDW